MRTVCRNILALISILALMVPSLGQAFCPDGCAGGVCEASEVRILCDLDASGLFCGQSCVAPQAAEVKLSNPQYLADCRLCGCFAWEYLESCIMVKQYTGRDLQPTANQYSLLPAVQPSIATNTFQSPVLDLRTHDPPVYRLTCALLI